MLVEKIYAVDPITIPTTSSAGDLSSFIDKIVTTAGIIIGALAFIYLVYAGILYITANGNDEQAKKGQKGIINAIIGIIVVILAVTIVKLASNFGNSLAT